MLRTIARYFNLFNLLFSFPVSIICEKFYLIIMAVFYFLIFELFFLKRKKCELPILIFTLYMEIACPFEMLLAEVNAADVFSVGRNLKKAYLLDSFDIHLQFYLLSIIFCIIVVAYYSLFLHIVKKRFCLITILTDTLTISKDSGMQTIGKVIIILLYAIFEYYLRTTYNLNVPGKIPLIQFAGVIVYLYMFFHQIIAYYCLRDFADKRAISIQSFAILVSEYLLLSIPDFLLDRRAPFLYLLILAFLYMYILHNELIEKFFRRYKWYMGLFTIAVLSGFNIYSSYVRYRGLYDLPFLHFISRIVGVADGFIALEYLSAVGLPRFVHFDISDYIVHTVRNTSESINYVYTHEVLGFPAEAVHSSSVPIFIGALMYGIIGYFLICIIFAFILSLTQATIENANLCGKKIYAYIGSYLSVYSVQMVMGGGAERMIELWTIPVMLLLYSSFERRTYETKERDSAKSRNST